MAFVAGTKIGPYEVHSAIGAGGMGEVYRARDTRLGRDVALKILPEVFVSDGDRLRRFEQEARAVAALSHPNILALFDIGQNNGSPYLVSELLEGESLRVRLEQGALPQRKALEYAVQIAQGLSAAHERGIVHRDLKPENIFVTRDGRVKILDFGLAKATAPGAPGNAPGDGMTLTSSHTALGVVMGTASYMAPEQVRGEQADARTDIFSFGAILYEMLAGQRAFRRDTSAESMTAVLKEEPPEFSTSRHAVSPAIERILRRCLEKNPEQRFQSAKDLSFALSGLSGTESGTARRLEPQHEVRPWLRWAGLAVAILLAGLLTWFLARRSPQTVSLQFAIPVTAEVSHMALSPDGSTLAFVSPDEKSAQPVVHIQTVGSRESRVLQGTEGASYPFWSPDGEFIAFFARGRLQKLRTSGGLPQALANVWSARGGSWGSRNVIIYEPDSGSPLWRINADGSGAAPLTDKIFVDGDQTHRWPHFLPDGNHFLFLAGSFAAPVDQVSGIFIGSLDGNEREQVVRTHSSFALTSDHLFFADADRHLVSLSFDIRRRKPTGNTTVVADDISFQPSTFWTAVTASQNGTLIFNTSTGGARSMLTWMDRTGKQLEQIGEPAIQCNPSLSPDNSRLAVDISDQRANNIDVWLQDDHGKNTSRFTFDPSEDVVAVWSRDGKFLLYRSSGERASGLRLKSANGLSPDKLILQSGSVEDIVPNSWSADNQNVVCTRQSASGYRLDLVSIGTGKATPIQLGPGNKSNGMISPDGKWMAYASDESGNWEIYVTTFPDISGKWQVSRNGGTEPRWRGDEKEVFYLAPGGVLTAVSASSSAGTFSTGSPTPLFQFHGRAAISSTDVFSYDVTRDGQRFLVNRYEKPANIAPLTIVLQMPQP
jgi:eukaryotic-like serine/threonine-protein kinase